MIETFANLIPQQLKHQSGSVFYSGRNAYNSGALLYMLGTNPGGSPKIQAKETVAWHTQKVMEREADDWSAYRDERWNNRPPGTCGMQPRVLHLLSKLGLEPGNVPASNVVFLRSARESTFTGDYRSVAELCWPFHRAVVEQLTPRVILCFGQTAGTFVLKKLGVHNAEARFTEKNMRRWTSVLYTQAEGPSVVVATHPSIADWTKEATDPSELVAVALRR